MASIKIEKIINPKDIQLDTSIDADNLNEEFVTISGKFAYYSTRQAMSAKQELRAKQNLELVFAMCDRQIRDDAEASKTKMTETAVKNAVLMDEKYQEAQASYNDAVLINQLAKGAVEAMRAKREALIQLGATHREEMKGTLRSLDGGSSLTERALEAAQNAARHAS